MPLAHRVFWGEGMFLRPQHFQQQAFYVEQQLRDVLHANCASPWGLRDIEIDRDALQAGYLRTHRLELLFPDGTALHAPGADPLPHQRELNSLTPGDTEVVIHACLPAIDGFGGNCRRRDADEAARGARPARYEIAEHPVRDLHSQALEADISVLHHAVRLMADSENRDGYLSVAVARLRRTASGQWDLDDQFIPPAARIAAAPALLAMLRRLLDILQVKSESLAAVHRERVQSVVEYGTSDIASFWLLHTVNRNFPLLAHYLHHPAAHPESLYACLAQLAGSLLTFSSTHDLNAIPHYRHDQLTEVFTRLDALIRELLGTVISSRYTVIPLESPKPSFFVGQLASDRLLEDVDFYLSAASEQPTGDLPATVPLKLKIGAPDDVDRIVNSALAGVRLNHAQQTPAAVPVRVGNHYFSLEPGGTLYERMLKSRSICIYVPQSLRDVKFELIAVFR